MKKYKIAIAISALPFLMQAQGMEYPDFLIVGLSPNGKVALSEYQGSIGTFNLETGEPILIPAQMDYRLGPGNAISDNGIFVGSSFRELAAYCDNGVWKNLPTPAGSISSYAMGISADGSMIVGLVSPKGYTGNFEGLMDVPCYWERKSDGTYADPVILPHPEVDFTGRIPQYVTALRVNDDCNFIAGQIIDNFGWVSQPIVYYKDASGEWQYKLIAEELMEGGISEFPPYPGDDAPVQQDFMTAEELAAYEAALKKWNESGSDDNYPVINDFMTPKEFEEFLIKLSEYIEQYEAFQTAYNTYIQNIPLFEMNNVFISNDGKYYASTDVRTHFDPETFNNIRVETPYLLNVETGEYSSYPNESLNVFLSSMADDGTLLAQSNYGDVYMGYILRPGEKEFISVVDYVETTDPATAEWMKQTMTHAYTIYDPSTQQTYDQDFVATGIPYCTPDLSLIGFGIENFWDDYTIANYKACYSYAFKPVFSGIEQISALPETGIYRVYDLRGVKVMETENADDINKLGKGLYIINGKKIIL